MFIIETSQQFMSIFKKESFQQKIPLKTASIYSIKKKLAKNLQQPLNQIQTALIFLIQIYPYQVCPHMK